MASEGTQHITEKYYGVYLPSYTIYTFAIIFPFAIPFVIYPRCLLYLVKSDDLVLIIAHLGIQPLWSTFHCWTFSPFYACICRGLLLENFFVFATSRVCLAFPAKTMLSNIVKYWNKYCQILKKILSNFEGNIVNFWCKNCQILMQILSDWERRFVFQTSNFCTSFVSLFNFTVCGSLSLFLIADSS